MSVSRGTLRTVQGVVQHAAVHVIELGAGANENEGSQGSGLERAGELLVFWVCFTLRGAHLDAELVEDV